MSARTPFRAIALLAGVASTTHAATVSYDWLSPFSDPAQRSMSVNGGDTIEFTNFAGHNVVRVSTFEEFEQCVTTAGAVLNPATTDSTSAPSFDSSFSYTVPTESAVLYLVCGVDSHCAMGQKLAVTVSLPRAPPVTEALPAELPTRPPSCGACGSPCVSAGNIPGVCQTDLVTCAATRPACRSAPTTQTLARDANCPRGQCPDPSAPWMSMQSFSCYPTQSKEYYIYCGLDDSGRVSFTQACEEYAQLGYCDTDPSYMASYCAGSCDSTVDGGSETSDMPTSMPVQIPSAPGATWPPDVPHESDPQCSGRCCDDVCVINNVAGRCDAFQKCLLDSFPICAEDDACTSESERIVTSAPLAVSVDTTVVDPNCPSDSMCSDPAAPWLSPRSSTCYPAQLKAYYIYCYGENYVYSAPPQSQPTSDSSRPIVYPLRATADFATSWNDIYGGRVTFEQASATSPTTITISNLVGTVGSNNDFGEYHIHEYAVDPLSSDPCGVQSVGGHYNPTSKPYPCVKSEECEVGDLSGKFGNLASSYTEMRTFDDTGLALADVLNRSIVIHDAENNARWVCATIERTVDGIPVTSPPSLPSTSDPTMAPSTTELSVPPTVAPTIDPTVIATTDPTPVPQTGTEPPVQIPYAVYTTAPSSAPRSESPTATEPESTSSVPTSAPVEDGDNPLGPALVPAQAPAPPDTASGASGTQPGPGIVPASCLAVLIVLSSLSC